MIFSSAPNDYLVHYGTKGQKWGIRRYQNPDGTLTPAGRERYYKDRVKQLKKEYNEKTEKSKRSERGLNKYIKENYDGDYKNDKKIAEERTSKRNAVIFGTATIATVGAAYAAVTLAEIGIDDINSRANTSQWDLFGKTRTENILNDNDGDFDKINKDTKLKRIIYDSKARSGEADEVKVHNESLYTVTSKEDLDRFKNFLGNMQGGTNKKEVTYNADNDLYIAKGKTLVNYSLEALGINKTADDVSSSVFDTDMRRVKTALIKMAEKDNSGKMTDPDAIAIRNKLVDEGFSGVVDYNDKKIWGETPTVIFNSKDNLSIDKIKKIGDIDQGAALIRTGARSLRDSLKKKK